MVDPTLNNDQPAPPFKLTPRMKVGVAIGFLTLMFISVSSLMLIFFSMLPTFVAYIIDRSYNRSNTICVGAANLCGVFPYLLELWLGQHSMAGAMLILTNLFNIAIMYFAAAFGWVLYIAIPPVIVSVQQVFDQHQVVHLKARQKKLLEEWSKAVAEDVKDSAVLKETLAKPSDESQASAEPGTPPSAAPPIPAAAGTVNAATTTQAPA